MKPEDDLMLSFLSVFHPLSPMNNLHNSKLNDLLNNMNIVQTSLGSGSCFHAMSSVDMCDGKNSCFEPTCGQ